MFQALTQLSVVVNLAVENQPDAIGATMHWLMTSLRQIDDRQPPKSKTAAPVIKDQFAGIVRSAVGHHVAHPLNQRALDATLGCSVFPNSADAAHALRFQISNLKFQISTIRILSPTFSPEAIR